MPWAEWWNWELELSPHVRDRMIDRQFSEVDLRLMLEVASHVAPSHVPDRWTVYTGHGSEPWEVVIELDTERRLIVVVTAYPAR